MIFVTVGTHEQPFNRLVEYMDKWARVHDEDVLMQIGYSTYEPKSARYKRLFSYKEMKKNIEVARIVITHGGPSSFIAPLQIGKVPIVVPRRKEYGEHVNDHQFEFCTEVEKRMRNIIVINNVDDLDNAIFNYEKLCIESNNCSVNNNLKFCNGVKMIVDEMFNLEDM